MVLQLSGRIGLAAPAAACVCLGDADSVAGSGQSSLVSMGRMTSVMAGGIGFAVPALESRRRRFLVLEHPDVGWQDQAFWCSSSPGYLGCCPCPGKVR